MALVHGAFPPALTVDRPIGRDRRVRTRQAIDLSDAGREAVTHLRRLEDLGRFSLLEARLDTGRTHQIRVHLESVGHPVVGDRVYGRREETLGLERQFLHAARLAFPHPETGEELDVREPPPARPGARAGQGAKAALWASLDLVVVERPATSPVAVAVVAVGWRLRLGRGDGDVPEVVRPRDVGP